jgi:hypothetical protein
MKTYFMKSKITAGNSLTPRFQIIASNTNDTLKGFKVIGTQTADSKRQALINFVPDSFLSSEDKKSPNQ